MKRGKKRDRDRDIYAEKKDDDDIFFQRWRFSLSLSLLVFMCVCVYTFCEAHLVTAKMREKRPLIGPIDKLFLDAGEILDADWMTQFLIVHIIEDPLSGARSFRERERECVFYLRKQGQGAISDLF